ncbi:MAG TPA: hypothetical protein PLU93_10760, partial [Treponemataceae bacterium]|nr:hypothetical protein [Treponemataceae bacterium]
SRRCSIPLIVSLLFSMFLFLSCGFEPAWKSQDTTVSFRLGPAARAIASGGGYLYVRPLGGPLGTGPKPYLGPIELGAGDTFTTTEIAPGSYDGFVVIYAPVPIDDSHYMTGRPVREDLIASDTDVVYAFFDGDNLNQSYLYDAILQGAGSGVNVGPVEIVEASVNEVRVLLSPLIAAAKNINVDLEDNYVFAGSSGEGTRHRLFLRLNGYTNLFNIASGYTNCILMASADCTFDVHALAFYDANGRSRPLNITTPLTDVGGAIL